MINNKNEECVYFRAVRPSLNKPEDYLRKCPDGICKINGVYFTTSLIEAITEWSREECDEEGLYKGKVIIYRPSPGANVYYPSFDYGRNKDEYKKYRNTRIIEEDKYLHKGCIKGEINYKYKCGCDREFFSIEIYEDCKKGIVMDVEAYFVDNDLPFVQRKLANFISEELSKSKIFNEFYIEVTRESPPKLKPCDPRWQSKEL